MKCPKCQYISFDSPDRCRNCGYDFSLASGSVTPIDPVLQRGSDADGPWPDLALSDRATAAPATPTPSAPTPPPRSRSRTDRLDLPLFNEPVPGLDDTPLISAPSAPRAPLAVRKATPDPSRVPRPSNRASRSPRATDTAPAAATPQAERGRDAEVPLAGWAREGLAVDPPEFPAFASEPTPVRVEPAPASHATPSVEAPDSDGGSSAPSVARLMAGVIDGLILIAIDVVVLYFTLGILRYPWSRLPELPLLPLFAFCLMLNAGYVVAFTVASGQTIGKMLTHVRVVTDESWRVPVPQAVIRTAIGGLSLLPLGLGYLPAFFGKDRRALHDRLSNTRVVRA